MSHWKNLPSMFSRVYFAENARVMTVFLDNIPIQAKPKVFSTGGLGWHIQAKKQMAVGDCMLWCQINVQVTVIGSKALPPNTEPAQGVVDAAA